MIIKCDVVVIDCNWLHYKVLKHSFSTRGENQGQLKLHIAYTEMQMLFNFCSLAFLFWNDTISDAVFIG